MRKEKISGDASFDESKDVASFTECTGLIPALPLNDPAADEDLVQLYAIHTPKKRNGIPIEGMDPKQR